MAPDGRTGTQSTTGHVVFTNCVPLDARRLTGKRRILEAYEDKKNIYTICGTLLEIQSAS